MNRKRTAILLMALIVTATTGCIGRLRVGQTQQFSKVVERGDAGTVRADVRMGVGEVNIEGGASELLEADFTYNVDAWKPEVSYNISGSEGRLLVEQPGDSSEGIPDGNIKYEWDLKLNDDTPLNLNVGLGVGNSTLDMQGLSLNRLDVEVGVGEATIDLTGDWKESFDVGIRGGVGKTTIYLPEGVGVRVVTQTGIGAIDVHGLIRNGDVYTNSSYETSDVILDISVLGGVGSIDLRLGR